ncbi:hybrid sensor histidine kinase/response regulator [Blastopirellula retiformator]|uniref:hybrid sensor histidine kinase/response regulator n=1 Tax=Blastopirellula retiformator TaxID=2527970 RepID=UPI001645F1A4|nr:hybrid sensor histidine kinase/response regulator [Blastopirellula retiformator]
MKVLLLEDDLADQQIIVRNLRDNRFDYQVTCVSRLADAIEQIRQSDFDVVVSDMDVPDSSGFETIQTLHVHCGETPLIALTAKEYAELAEKILLAGAQDYLEKGEVQGNSLSRAILHAIRRQETLNQNRRLARRLKGQRAKLRDQARQLQRKNRRLRKLYRTAREFVDNVSHDLRTPLTVIKDYVSILRDGMAGEVNDEQMRLLGKVAIRADDLNNIVDDILDASKLEAGVLGAWRRSVSIPQLISHASSLLRERAAIHDVQLVIECPDDLPEAYCDSEKAVRVIVNLAINALKYSQPGQTVVLWASHNPVDGEIRIGVTDHGPGIDEESLQQIFQRFEQLKDDVATTVKGHGLGLNIAQRLTRINLGDLDVASEVGTGSVFSFTIPVAEPGEIFWRWMELRGSSDTPLVAMKISLGDDAEAAHAEDFDRFANYLLRRQDILFRLAPREWLLMLPMAELDLPHWEAQADLNFSRFVRNRPQGPIPGFCRSVFKTWLADADKESILTDFDALIAQQSTRPVADYLAAY